MEKISIFNEKFVEVVSVFVLWAFFVNSRNIFLKKLARWGFLIWGIIHGFRQNIIFKKQEECCREQERERKLIQAPILQREKEIRDRGIFFFFFVNCVIDLIAYNFFLSAEAEELKRMFLGDEKDECPEDDDDECFDEDDLGY